MIVVSMKSLFNGYEDLFDSRQGSRRRHGHGRHGRRRRHRRMRIIATAASEEVQKYTGFFYKKLLYATPKLRFRHIKVHSM